MRIKFTFILFNFLFVFSSFSNDATNIQKTVLVGDKTTVYFSDSISFTTSNKYYNEILESGKAESILERIKVQLDYIYKLKSEIEVNKKISNDDLIKLQKYLEDAKKNFFNSYHSEI